MRNLCLLSLFSIGLLLVACSRNIQRDAPLQTGEAEAAKPPETVNFAGRSTETPSFATPSPAPCIVTIGAVGDIMIMPKQIVSAYRETEDIHDFSASFFPMEAYLRDVDFMCGNLEGTFAGEEQGYTKSIRSGQREQRFSSPDGLARDLKEAGFDVLTTANNHCLDYGWEGLRRTEAVLREAGIRSTGTAITEYERNHPLILEKNGLRIGIVAATEYTNDNQKYLKPAEREFAVTRLEINKKRYLSDVRACRAQGADFVIAFPHWGEEDVTEVDSGVRIYANELLKAGADVVLGSHPHRVQAMEYVTVEREDGPYTGLVVYSMGNFLSNMLHIPEQYGLYVRLTVRKDGERGASLEKAELMPLLTISHAMDAEGETELHEVLPAQSALTKIAAQMELTPYDRGLLEGARAHIMETCLIEGVSMMEDLCLKN